MVRLTRVPLLLPLSFLLGCQGEALGPKSDAADAGPRFANVGSAPASPAIAFGDGRILKVMNADGTNQTGLASTAFMPIPSWAPFGAGTETDPYRIVFAQSLCQIARIDVVVVNGTVQGKNLTSLPTTSNACHPVWSPLGGEIAFDEASTDQPPSSLWVMPAQGGIQTSLYDAPTGFRVVWPTWSRDGSRLAFVEQSEATNASAIRILDRTTATTTTVLQLAAGYFIRGLDWARTKDVLAYSVQPPTGGDVVYTLNVNPVGTPTQIVSGTGPTWSPDDGKLAFRSPTAGKIVSIDLATKKTTTLAVGGAWPDWRRF